MPVFGPISRRELVATLKAAGFSGPYSGGKHQFIKIIGSKTTPFKAKCFWSGAQIPYFPSWEGLGVG
ncbi:MAG: hypothetical protein F6K48_22115 [Okeania sp. SIO3H1]|uniref:hypothetical protein n=1 Tax=Okeania sp. SIO1I7 TaxID=2607772 RepID=UPI0013C589CD|nr:hypothetical protein [Okeania sp. SIO1I7]NEN91452.1 hypothetical protein [Okeania sp. SIO3H1]NET27146.1 hypothetical protein [Okeania sp. SIO1I7]